MTKRTVLLLAAAAIALSLAQPARAQFTMPGVDLNPDGSRTYTPEEKEKMQEIDKQYKATIQKVPDKSKAYDPWAGARQNPSATTKQNQR